jgi:hypothetical protein
MKTTLGVAASNSATVARSSGVSGGGLAGARGRGAVDDRTGAGGVALPVNAPGGGSGGSADAGGGAAAHSVNAAARASEAARAAAERGAHGDSCSSQAQALAVRRDARAACFSRRPVSSKRAQRQKRVRQAWQRASA